MVLDKTNIVLVMTPGTGRVCAPQRTNQPPRPRNPVRRESARTRSRELFPLRQPPYFAKPANFEYIVNLPAPLSGASIAVELGHQSWIHGAAGLRRSKLDSLAAA